MVSIMKTASLYLITPALNSLMSNFWGLQRRAVIGEKPAMCQGVVWGKTRWPSRKHVRGLAQLTVNHLTLRIKSQKQPPRIDGARVNSSRCPRVFSEMLTQQPVAESLITAASSLDPQLNPSSYSVLFVCVSPPRCAAITKENVVILCALSYISCCSQFHFSSVTPDVQSFLSQCVCECVCVCVL